MTAKAQVSEIADHASLQAKPLVSVLTLAYRHEKFLSEAIEGILAQRCDFPFELVIAEDCSPDGTLAIAMEYQRRRPELVRVITADKNVGAYANSRRGVAATRGKYVAFCEGDDYWQHPRKLQMQVEAMTASNVTLCHTEYDRKAGPRLKRNQHASRRTPYLAQGNAYESLLYGWSVMTATAMYRRDILEDFYSTPFNNPRWPFGDYNKALYASVRGQVAYLPISTATWRKVAGSASNADLAAMLRMRLASLECRETFIAHYPVSEDVRTRSLANANRIVMKYAFYAGNMAAYETACGNLAELGCPPPRLQDLLMRAGMHTKFPVRAVDLMRRLQLRFFAN